MCARGCKNGCVWATQNMAQHIYLRAADDDLDGALVVTHPAASDIVPSLGGGVCALLEKRGAARANHRVKVAHKVHVHYHHLLKAHLAALGAAFSVTAHVVTIQLVEGFLAAGDAGY